MYGRYVVGVGLGMELGTKSACELAFARHLANNKNK